MAAGGGPWGGAFITALLLTVVVLLAWWDPSPLAPLRLHALGRRHVLRPAPHPPMMMAPPAPRPPALRPYGPVARHSSWRTLPPALMPPTPQTTPTPSPTPLAVWPLLALLPVVIARLLRPRAALHAPPPTRPPWALYAVVGRRSVAWPTMVGVAVTAYLLLDKAALAPAICGPAGCSAVLAGPFATVAGVPVAVPGLMAYSLLLALVLTAPPSGGVRRGGAVVVLSTAMATFSAYLVALLAFQLHEFCPLCVTSAVAATTACALAWASGWAAPLSPAGRQACLQGAVGVGLAGAAVHYGWGTAHTNVTLDGVGPFAPPDITAPASPQTLALAERLKALDARMYGAFWCSHCYTQKQTLGLEAAAFYEYIECDANGVASQRATCKARGVTGYPTWEVAGVLLPGEKSVPELEAIVAAGEVGGDVMQAAEDAFLAAP